MVITSIKDTHNNKCVGMMEFSFYVRENKIRKVQRFLKISFKIKTIEDTTFLFCGYIKLHEIAFI